MPYSRDPDKYGRAYKLLAERLLSDPDTITIPTQTTSEAYTLRRSLYAYRRALKPTHPKLAEALAMRNLIVQQSPPALILAPKDQSILNTRILDALMGESAKIQEAATQPFDPKSILEDN